MAEEETDIAWKSLIYQVPRGPGATPDNLERWGVRVDPKLGLEGCG